MSYTALAVLAVLLSAGLDLAVLRTRLLRRRAFWVSYAIIVAAQLLMNGVLTGLRIVRYAPAAILGPRLAYAPVEDLLFGFALVLQTLAWWVWWGRVSRPRGGQAARPPARRAARARANAGPATASRRDRPTDTRRSRTW